MLLMKIEWTKKQIDIYHALQAGKSHTQITKDLKVTKPIVTKVANAMANGDYPGKPPEPETPPVTPSVTPPPAEQTASKTDQAQVVKQHKAAEAQMAAVALGGNTPGNTPGEDGAGAQNTGGAQAPTQPQTSPRPSADLTTSIKLVPVTATIALTPIMHNMRNLCIMELGWSDKMPWEDIIDTIFYHMAHAWGFVLQGWYKVEDNGHGDSSKPARGEPSGNGAGNGKKAETGGGNTPSSEVSEEDIQIGLIVANFLKKEAAKIALSGGKTNAG